MRFITFLFKNLLRRKTRTLLTCFGISVAVGTTISLLGISDNFKRETMRAFTGRDIGIVILQKDVLDQLTSDLPENTGKIIEKEIPEVESTAKCLLEIIAYSVHGTTITLPLQGWDSDSFLFERFKILEGRKLQHGDDDEVILGNIIAELIDKKPGDTMIIEGGTYNVIGIYESPNLQENRGAIINLPHMQKMFFRERYVTGLSVRLKDKTATKEDISAIAKRINEIKDEQGELVKVNALPTEEYVSNTMHIRMAQSMAWLTSIIAIFVGAIGMLNTMVMSVVERVKEISILRAIGWRKTRIVRMIVGESVLMSISGTILGAVGSVILIRVLVLLPQVSGYLSNNIPWTAFAKGIFLAFMIGLFGGIYPAYRAVQLMPSEGLRHE